MIKMGGGTVGLWEWWWTTGFGILARRGFPPSPKWKEPTRQPLVLSSRVTDVVAEALAEVNS